MENAVLFALIYEAFVALLPTNTFFLIDCMQSAGRVHHNACSVLFNSARRASLEKLYGKWAKNIAVCLDHLPIYKSRVKTTNTASH